MQKVVAGRAANSPATSHKMRLFHMLDDPGLLRHPG